MTQYSCFFLSLLLFSTITRPSWCFPDAASDNKLVEKVCKQTSNYSFCVASLYRDARTPQADAYTLAYISVGLAYTNATSTRDLISHLLKNLNDTNHHALQRCLRDYARAVSALKMVYIDLDSETFFEMAALSNQSALAASNCEAAFPPKHRSRPLASRNQDLIHLCEVCVVVAKFFTGLLL